MIGNSNRVPFLVRKKAGVVAIEALFKEPAEEVDAELINKVLKSE